MIFGTSYNLVKQNTDQVDVTYQFQNLFVTKTYKYLGINLNPTLNTGNDFACTIKKANSRMRLLKKVRSSITVKGAKTLYQSLIMTTITYSSLLNLKPTDTQRKILSSFHEKAMSVIFNSTIPQEQIMSPYAVMLFKCCMLVTICIDANICSNFTNYFETSQNTKVTRNKGKFLQLPKIRLEYSRSSFYYMGAKHFNDLPLCIRSQESMVLFKSELKKHLCRIK